MEEQVYPFKQAAAVAQELLDRLRPYCEQMQVAGSIRRLCKEVGDVEILFVPKFEEQKVNLLDVENVSMADRALSKMLEDGTITKRLNAKGQSMWGPQNKFAVHAATGIPVDFFATTPANWWVALVVRTGSKETNLLLTTGANKQNKTLQSYGCGVLDRRTGAVEVCNSEEDVFRLCQVPFRKPQDR
jgi:DNA polymerase/3'-5' exonuclease PolX